MANEMKTSPPLRVLQILPGLSFCGGIESYLMNYYRRMDKRKLQFDFITHSVVDPSLREEIESMGGRVYDWPSFSIKTLFRLYVQIDRFFSEHSGEYPVIHCHMANAAFLYFPIAKKYGIKHRILHSHNNKAAAIWSHAVRNYPLLFLGNSFATDRWACTDSAGKFLFRDKSFEVIKNAIEIQKFAFDETTRKELRRELGVDDFFVIGHVGRLDPQKNQSYLLRIFDKILQRRSDARLLLIGDGDDRAMLRRLADRLGISGKVEFLGICKDVERYYQAFDVFVFPSLYEGLGIVLVEAQCSGLPVYTSNENVPKEVGITDLVSFISCKDSPEVWAESILSRETPERRGRLDAIRDAGYDIHVAARHLEERYLKLA